MTLSLTIGNHQANQFLLEIKKYNKTLIPVTIKMVNSAVSECNQFVLKDGCQLHLIKVVGVIVHYHEY